MKRKLRCKTCQTTTNSATGQPLYLIGENDYILMILDTDGECFDCGERRRETEQKKKQDRSEALVNRFNES